MGTVDGDSYDEEEVGNYQVGNVDEGSDYEEEVGNDDEVTEERGMEENLERSGMGSDEILEFMEENCKCCILLY